MKKLLELFILFLTGGVIYFCAEMLIRGRSHWSMFICGGICFLAIGGINENLDYDIPLVEQMIYGILQNIIQFLLGLQFGGIRLPHRCCLSCNKLISPVKKLCRSQRRAATMALILKILLPPPKMPKYKKVPHLTICLKNIIRPWIIRLYHG